MKTGAVIAAAGMSSRMNSFKPLLGLGDSTIIGTAVTALQSAGVREIAAVTGNNSSKLTEYLIDEGVICLYNSEYKATDMYYSACIGLQYIKDKCDRVFFLPADVPLFSCQNLLTMLDYMDHNGCRILLPVCQGKLGHPILLECSIIPCLTGYTGNDGLRGAIESFNGKKDTIMIEDRGMILDADKPEDYELLKAYAAEKAEKPFGYKQ